MKAWQHFKTITRHKWLVFQGCARVGLYWQGITHDLSKYMPTEFLVGVRYFQGTRSPNAAEREEKGYSEAWMHHKGRNRHHYEYWTDLSYQTRQYESVEMPRKYFVEMIMDLESELGVELEMEDQKISNFKELAEFIESKVN